MTVQGNFMGLLFDVHISSAITNTPIPLQSKTALVRHCNVPENNKTYTFI